MPPRVMWGGMSSETIIRARRLKDGTLVEVLTDGGTRPFPPDQTDWARVDAMTDKEVHAAALSDPDAQPLTEDDFKRMKRVPQVKVMRRALRLSRRNSRPTIIFRSVPCATGNRVGPNPTRLPAPI
jgi:hypothetical protein